MYIAFCGIDGAGKTTVINRIMDSGHDAVFTREPYHPDVKEAVGRVDPVELSYLFAHDRYLHMKDVIIPAKKAGRNIISDRCYLCSLAFQSYDGVDLQWLMQVQPENLVFPDYVIFFQGLPEVAARRSGEDADRLRAIQHGYAEILSSYELPLMAWYPINVDGKTIDEIYVETALLISELGVK